MLLRTGLFVIAAILLAAHFFRSGGYLLVGLCLAAPLLFFHKRRWSLLLLQLGAYVASASWLGTTLTLIQYRQQTGRSWTAAAAILGAVSVITLLAGLMLNARCMRERYPFSSTR
ncbi:MAG: hypothetical protein ACOYNZ_03310 [Rhodoferax sp.]